MKFNPAIAYRILQDKQTRLFEEASKVLYERIRNEHTNGYSLVDPRQRHLESLWQKLYDEAYRLYDVLNYLQIRMGEES